MAKGVAITWANMGLGKMIRQTVRVEKINE
jgi:hypothetical protein